MRSEPPVGDDLQRMLVSMKRNVLDRAVPRPRRRRARSGIVIAVVALLALGTATGAVALTLTQQEQPVAAPTQTADPEPAPTATTPTSAPITATPVPTSPSTPEPVVTSGDATIPTTCRAVVPDAEYDRLFGDREPVQVPARSEDDAVDQRFDGGATALDCRWGASEGPSPGLSLSIGTGTSAQLAVGRSMLFDGWQPSCRADDGGERCSATATSDGTESARTRYERDGVWIEVVQGNFPTDGLLDAVIGQVWGAGSSVEAHRHEVCEAAAAGSGVLALRSSAIVGPGRPDGSLDLVYGVIEFQDGHTDPYAGFACILSDDGAQAEFVQGGLVDSH